MASTAGQTSLRYMPTVHSPVEFNFLQTLTDLLTSISLQRKNWALVQIIYGSSVVASAGNLKPSRSWLERGSLGWGSANRAKNFFWHFSFSCDRFMVGQDKRKSDFAVSAVLLHASGMITDQAQE